MPHLEQKLFPAGDLYMEPCHGKLKNIPSNKGTLKKKQTKELWCLPMCKTCKTYNDRLPLLTKNCNLILTWAAISEAACFGF